MSNSTGVRPNVIVVGKNKDKYLQVERDQVKAEQELILRREAKLAKWFADTELSGKHLIHSFSPDLVLLTRERL